MHAKGARRVSELSIPCSLIEDVVNEIEKTITKIAGGVERRKKIQSRPILFKWSISWIRWLFWKIEHKDKSIRQLIQSCLLTRWTMGLSLVSLETKGTSYICWINRMRL